MSVPDRSRPPHVFSRSKALYFCVLAALFSGCTSDDAALRPVPTELVALGLQVDVVAEGLVGPTQLVVLDNGDLLVGQLNGGENEQSGQVVRIDAATNVHTVLFDRLDKPTGVAFFAGEVWVMQRTSLWKGPLTGGSLEPVIQDLPSNGRSEGTLTPLNDDELVYITSGKLEGNMPSPGSGSVFAIDKEGSSRTLATGFKNAYGHAVGADSTLWVTEVSDGLFDGEPAQDEVGRLQLGQDHGWPWCVGANHLVVEFARSEEECIKVPQALAVFEPGATPTSVAVAPWDNDRLLVALWNRGQVVEVQISNDSANGPATLHPIVLSGVEHPQSLTTDGHRVLLVDFDRGIVLSLTED